MARYAIEGVGRDHIDAVVDRWKQQCLIADGSLLYDDRAIWRSEHIEDFHRRFFDRAFLTEDRFIEKLVQQLQTATQDVRVFVAEVAIVYSLMVFRMMGAAAKEELVRVALGPDQDLADAPHWPEVAVAFNEGIAHPGVGYNARRDLQFEYLLDFAARFKRLAPADRVELLDDSQRLCAFADDVEPRLRREMRNILLHLLRPDEFERISSFAHKDKIAAAFGPEVEQAAGALPDDLDERLLFIRRHLEATGQAVDFYDPPWKEQWQGTKADVAAEDDNAAHDGAPRWWWVNQGQTYAAERADGFMWAPLESKNGLALAHWDRLVDVRPGDFVVHYSSAIRAISLVQAPAEEAPKPTSLKTDSWGKLGRLVRTEYRDLPQPIERTEIPLEWRQEEETAGPFTREGTVKQGYFFRLSPGFAGRMLQRFEELRIAAGASANINRDGALAELRDVHGAVKAALAQSGLVVSAGGEDRVRSVLAALVAKPFVILSGLSGSGKTQLGLRLGEWCGANGAGDRLAVVAVRPDWTGPEALFGYEDLLQPSVDGRPAWHVPATLEFMLRAALDTDEPYVLLLDEMNLAYVERYFSDFLSGVESGKGILPNLVKEDGAWRRTADGPAYRELPRNLFIVGTVNVDETTYQFSPKVLDRAFSFEVRTRTEDLSLDLKKPSTVQEGEPVLRQTLARQAQDPTWHLDPGHPERENIGAALRRLHEALTVSGDEFGHRVMYEALRFAAALHDFGDSDADRALDLIVMTKLLPRVHGSQRRVQPVLRRLRRFTEDPDQPVAALQAFDDPSADAPRLPLSAAKLDRMLERLKVDQFVSFAG
jgi:5-methylcytosine-specific restriction protein B